MKKTEFCNSEFYLSRTKHISDKSATADGTLPYLEEFKTSGTIQHV